MFLQVKRTIYLATNCFRVMINSILLCTFYVIWKYLIRCFDPSFGVAITCLFPFSGDDFSFLVCLFVCLFVCLSGCLSVSLIVCYSRSFAKAVGCEVTSLKVCAKQKSVEDILAAQLKVFQLPNFLPFAPVVDGYFLPGMRYPMLINESRYINYPDYIST